MKRHEKDVIGGQMLRERKQLLSQQACLEHKISQAKENLTKAQLFLGESLDEAPEPYPDSEEVKMIIIEKKKIQNRLEELQKNIDNFC